MTIWEPDVALTPLQPFEAVQESALVVDQERVEFWPDKILVGEAEKVRVGGGATAQFGKVILLLQVLLSE